jgi:hypothetical protein
MALAVSFYGLARKIREEGFSSKTAKIFATADSRLFCELKNL